MCKHKFILVFFTLLILILILAACGQPETSTEAAPASTPAMSPSPSSAPVTTPALTQVTTTTATAAAPTTTSAPATTAPVSATTTPAATTPAMQRGTADPDFSLDFYLPELAWHGTTLLPDNHRPDRPRIIEVNMLGEIIWEYVLPEDMKQYTNPGFDVELLGNNNIMIVLPRKGIYEIDRSGKIVWSHPDPNVSHDADRLPNGNTLYVFGNEDQKADAQVKEITPDGKPVWSWYARDYFDKAPYDTIFDQGWTHTNAVSRLASGNTLISPRNFNLLVEVDSAGKVVTTYGEGIFQAQHDPAVLPNGNILLANHARPHQAIEYNPKTGKVVWKSMGFEQSATPVRDANRLPNGNTLITCSTKIVEVTPELKVTWALSLRGVTFSGMEAAGLGFYKAERIGVAK